MATLYIFSFLIFICGAHLLDAARRDIALQEWDSAESMVKIYAGVLYISASFFLLIFSVKLWVIFLPLR